MLLFVGFFFRARRRAAFFQSLRLATGAVIISGFVALTLSPMLCARILSHSKEETGLRKMLATGFDRLASGYATLLKPSLRRPGLMMFVGVAWVVLGVALLRVIEREFIPTEDRGAIPVFTRVPEGSTIEYMDRYQHEVEQLVMATPEIAKSFSVIALGIGTPGPVNEGAIFSS